jgi:hypothetical protein
MTSHPGWNHFCPRPPDLEAWPVRFQPQPCPRRDQQLVSACAAKLIPGPKPEYQSLKPEAVYMLQEALLRGEVGRGEMFRVSGMAERAGRILLGQLLDEGLLVSDTPKGAVRLKLSTHLAGRLFPDLYPVQIA